MYFYHTEKAGGFAERVRFLLAVVLLACVSVFSFQSEAVANGRRVAFVVGNSAYQNVPALPNPTHDAKAVEAALKHQGFEVISAYDLDHAAFDEQLQQFVRTLAGADVSLFYYSGHGIQIGGDNRIIPVDAALKTSLDLEVETVSIKTILGYMQAGSRIQAVFLDSCRNNPFPANSFLVGSNQEAVPKSGGLAALVASQGSLIAYSTQPGNVAVDGTGELSPFTEAFLKRAFKLGVNVQSALMKVTQDVWESTDHQQRPWTSYTLVEPLFLARPAVMIAAADPAARQKPAVAVLIKPAPQQATDEPAPPAFETIAQNVVNVFEKPHRIPIGVGAVAMLGDMPVYRGDLGVQIEISKGPGSGVMYLDDKPLLDGSIISQSDLHDVRYEPSLDSNGRTENLSLKVMAQADAPGVPVEGKLVPYFVGCDSEAGEPLDLQGVDKGKLPNEINPDTAINACMKAVADYPEIARYKYQLGRAKLANKDVQGALALFHEAQQAGHIRSSVQLGYMAQRGLGRAQDIGEATRLFKIGAEGGDPYGMLDYGRNLVFGRGVAADPKAGIGYLNRAVELGHTYAMNELGSLYYYGRAVKKNAARGVRFYEAALARGDIYAMNNLGLAYLDGVGVKRDPATALALFTKASAGGHPSAPTNIGNMYFKGKGVKLDMAAATKWYETGAERGDTWSASNLGWIYSKGPEKQRDPDKAALNYGLAVALDAYGSNPDAATALKALPDASKANIIKQLIAELGPDGLETTSSLNSTLVLLERKAWQNRNPRLDLF